jgi:hypothetical protein
LGAQIQEDAVTADPAGTALGQLYVDAPGRREAGIAHDKLGAASPVAIQMQLAQALGHGALPVLDALHVRRRGLRFDPEFGGPPGQ